MKTLIQVITYLIIVFGLTFLCSCHQTIPAATTTVYRATVAENGSITMVHMNDEQYAVYKSDDSVWVNLRTHQIDDVNDSAMLCILEYEAYRTKQR